LSSHLAKEVIPKLASGKSFLSCSAGHSGMA
jgi:hypothetical protein